MFLLILRTLSLRWLSFHKFNGWRGGSEVISLFLVTAGFYVRVLALLVARRFSTD